MTTQQTTSRAGARLRQRGAALRPSITTAPAR